MPNVIGQVNINIWELKVVLYTKDFPPWMEIVVYPPDQKHLRS